MNPLYVSQSDQCTFVGVRDYTIILRLIETGIRVRELVDIKLDDIVWKESMIKGYNQRLVTIQIGIKKQPQCYV